MSEIAESDHEGQIIEPKIILSQAIIEKSVSGLCRIGASYGYSTLEANEQEIQELVDVNKDSATNG